MRLTRFLPLLAAGLLAAVALGCMPADRQVFDIRAADGLNLNTEMTTPPGFPEGGPYPTILVRTPYGRQGQRDEAQRWTSRGYVFIAQEIRGTGGSRDRNAAIFEADGWGPKQDARDTADWITAQSWSNGEIGTVGFSAPAIASALAAGATKKIRSQVIEASMSTMYGHATYWGGVLRADLTGPEWDVIGKWRANPRYNDFWAHHDVNARAPFVEAAALHIGGWYDLFSQGAIDGFMTRQENGGLGAQGNQKLIMGPWTHNSDIGAGQLNYPNSRLEDSPIARSRDDLRRDFHNFWLRGEGDELDFTVMYYTMGANRSGAPGNEWRFAESWPPFETAYRAYFLYPDGSLSTAPPLGIAGEWSYFYDPRSASPTLGGNNLLIPSGAFDQSALAARSDTLYFESAPLAAPLEVTGNVRAQFYVSSSAVDTDFTAKFVDVYPDGRQMLVLDGIQRVRYREGFDVSSFLPPGQVGVVEIDLWTTSLVLDAGHRIGLHVSSSNTPRFEPHTNTELDHFVASAAVIAENTIHLGALTPSALYLPMPANLDVDGDGLNEAEEAENRTDPLNPDTDNDGWSDGEEIDFGASPLDPDDFPVAR